MTTIIEAVHTMYDAGIRQIDIYYAELINDGETEWSVDVMCDPINDIAECSWTWTVSSFDLIYSMMEDDDYFVCADWEIIAIKPFTNEVVSGAIDEWLLSNGFDMTTRVIDIDDAVGSGYVRELRNRDLEHELNNSVPLGTRFLSRLGG